MENQRKDITELITETLTNFRKLGYGEPTIKTHSTVYADLRLFCQSKEITFYSEEVGEQYIEAKGQQQYHEDTLYNYRLAIRRLSCSLNGVEWKPAPRLPRKARSNTCFDGHMANAISRMEEWDYSAEIITKHYTVYRDLNSYCRENAIAQYTEEIGERYMEVKRQQQWAGSTLNFYWNAIRRLNSALTGTEWTRSHPPARTPVKTCFDNHIENYKKYLIRTGKGLQDVRQRILVLTGFLSYAEQNGYTKLSDLSVQCVHCGFKATTDKRNFRYMVGGFLRYAYKYNLINTDLFLAIPSVRMHTSVPSVYTPEEVERLLASNNRSTRIGKRDYAIMLVAARLGLRASDIHAMKFDCLRKPGIIEIVQKKTKAPLSVPLTDEIYEALNDYIGNGRQPSDSEHIFLSYNGYRLLSASAIGSVVKRAIKRTGIDSNGRSRGSHSLRSSLATALLAEGNDFYTIKRVLGQQSIQNTKAYARVDIESLRTNALPVPPPSGSFEALLGRGACNEKLCVCVCECASQRTERLYGIAEKSRLSRQPQPCSTTVG